MILSHPGDGLFYLNIFNNVCYVVVVFFDEDFL